MSSADAPLLGCRVSIISKASIRYEGILDSIDFETPNEPVITLSKVWAFGTEDRPCSHPFAPSNEEYAKVVFRGRDLTDVSVIQPPNCLNEDSAVVSAVPGPSSSHSLGLTQTDNRNRIDPFGSIRSPEPPTIPYSQSASLDNFSRTGTPSHLPAVSSRPTAPVTSDNPRKPDTRGSRPFVDGHNDGDQSFFNASKKLDFNLRGQELQASDVGRMGAPNSNPWSNRDHNYKKTGLYKSSNNYPSGQEYQRDRRGGFNSYFSSNNRGPRGGAHHHWNVRGGANPGWGRYRTAPSHNQIETTDFSVEYDIEKGNAELAAELEKITLDEKWGSSNGSDKSTGKTSDTQSPTEEPVCYDQSKSFYDTISSEMMDRAKGINQQAMKRRDERSLNSTTFGPLPNHYSKRSYGGSRPFGYAPRRIGNSSGGNYARPASGSYSKSFSHNSSYTPLASGRVG